MASWVKRASDRRARAPRRAFARAAFVLSAALAVGGSACGKGAEGAREPSRAPDGALPARVSFAFDSLDGRPVSTAAMLGKPSVVTFLATWDLVCQAQVGYLTAMATHDADTTNYAMVALQPRSDRELVEAYARALKVEFPVALGDQVVDSQALGITEVPTTLVLDRNARVVFRKAGLVKSDELRAALKAL